MLLRKNKDILRVPGLRICITSLCNLKCEYCSPAGESFCGKVAHSSQIALTEGQIVNFLEVASKKGLQLVRWTGGEPLLSLPKIVKIMKECKRKNLKIRFGLTTNGILLRKSIKKLLNSNLSAVIVSLDTLNKELFKKTTKGTYKDFKEIIKGIKEAKKYFPVRIDVVVTKDNYREIPKLIEFAKKYNIYVKLADLNYFEQPGKKFWKNNYYPLEPIVKKLKNQAEACRIILNVGAQGIPMYEFKTGRIKIFVKDSSLGTHYALECKPCPLYPAKNTKYYCQEGIYEMFLTVDGLLVICKHRGDMGVDLKKIDMNNPKEIEKALSAVLRYYKNSEFVSKKFSRKHYRDVFVCNSIQDYF